jgi:hypothetical protein
MSEGTGASRSKTESFVTEIACFHPSNRFAMAWLGSEEPVVGVLLSSDQTDLLLGHKCLELNL